MRQWRLIFILNKANSMTVVTVGVVVSLHETHIEVQTVGAEAIVTENAGRPVITVRINKVVTVTVVAEARSRKEDNTR